MKWFKHLSGSLNDNLIFDAVEEFGSDAYIVYFGVLEILADEFDIYNPGIVAISYKKLLKNLQLSRQKTVRILELFDQKAKKNNKKNVSFHVEFQDRGIIVNCPKFKDLCDEYTCRLMQQESGQTPDANRDKLRKISSIKQKQKQKQNIKIRKTDDFFKKCETRISDISKLILETNRNFEVGKWIDIQIQNSKNETAILETLDQVIKYWDSIEKSIWKYADTILLTRNQNCNESDSIRESNNFKEILKGVAKNVEIGD